MPKCTKCNTNEANATGVLCDQCMMDGAIPSEEQIVSAPPLPEPVQMAQPPTRTDTENDEFDRFTKEFEEDVSVQITINYTQNFSEITVLKGKSVVETMAYDDKEVFKTKLDEVITAIEAKEALKKKLAQDRKEHFESVKTIANDLGFKRLD